MNDYKLSPDDPRLTAYALGELDADERAAVEAALRDDPAARAAVEQIRALGAQLTDALAHEPAPEVAPRKSLANAAIIAPHEWRPVDTAPLRETVKFVRFPQLYYVIGGLAAACFALFLTLRTPPPAAVETKPLAPLAIAPPAPGRAPASAVAELRLATPTEADNPAAAKTLADVAASGGAAGLKKDSGASTDAVAASAPRDAAAVGAIQPAPAVAEKSASNAPAVASHTDAAERVRTFPPDEKIVVDTSAAPTTPAMEKSLIAVPPPTSPAMLDSVVRAEPTRPTTPTGSGAFVGAATPLLPPKTGALAFSANAASAADAKNPAATRAANSILSPPAAPIAGGNELIALNSFAVSSSGGRTSLDGGVTTLTNGRRSPARAPLAVGWRDNGFVSPLQSPLSTFAMSADTSSYAAIRRFLQLKRLPPQDAVRIEELVNYFPYRYAPPKGDAPFAATMEVTEAPWSQEHLLVRIGLKAREVASVARPPANLAIVIDALDTDRVKNHLPMIKTSVQNLIGKLRPDDRVALVSCENNGRIALPPTPVSRAREILDALDAFAPATSSRRVQGIQLGYDLLQSNFAVGATNRVIFCTDGNSGVTVTDEERLLRYIDDRAKAGISLAAFGYGLGIYHDELLDLLLRYRPGSFGYLDWRRDIENALVEDVNGAPVTIAKDVNVQVEFNPTKVASYRLIGYDNRELTKEDFPAEAFETEEVGAGHAFTALFEIVPAAGPPPASKPPLDGLRYQPSKQLAAVGPAIDPNELLNVKVNYKKPGGAIPRRLELPLADSRTRFVNASADFKFAAAVAGFGMILRESPYKGSTTMGHVVEWAEAGNTDDPGGYRGEFIGLAREAQALEK